MSGVEMLKPQGGSGEFDVLAELFPEIDILLYGTERNGHDSILGFIQKYYEEKISVGEDVELIFQTPMETHPIDPSSLLLGYINNTFPGIPNSKYLIEQLVAGSNSRIEKSRQILRLQIVNNLNFNSSLSRIFTLIQIVSNVSNCIQNLSTLITSTENTFKRRGFIRGIPEYSDIDSGFADIKAQGLVTLSNMFFRLKSILSNEIKALELNEDEAVNFCGLLRTVMELNYTEYRGNSVKADFTPLLVNALNANDISSVRALIIVFALMSHSQSKEVLNQYFTLTGKSEDDLKRHTKMIEEDAKYQVTSVESVLQFVNLWYPNISD